MDYDKLIERLRNAAGGPEGIQMCQDAATAIEALQAESIMHHNAADNYWHELNEYREERNEALADLTRVTAERNAAVKDLNEFLSMDELCPIQCEWCKWNGTYCDGKTPEWRGIKEG